MALASRFVHPMDYAGTYPSNWAGYTFKAALDYGTGGRHTGVDYNGPGAGNADLGMPARNIGNGIVRAIDNTNAHGFGKVVIAEHLLVDTLKAQLGCPSLFSRHMHLNSISVSVGQTVSLGQNIGTVGNTGTTWAHLHLDLYKSTIEGGGVHWRYDKHTELQSYLDPFLFIQSRLSSTDTGGQPMPALQPNQRILSNPTGVNQRTAPSTTASIIKEWPYDQEPFTFKGYVKGESVNGNNIWFVGGLSGGYFWSGAFVGGSNTTGLSDLSAPAPVPPQPQPAPPPAPSPPVYIDFTKELDVITSVLPAHVTNYELNNFPAQPVGIVIHDFGTDGKDTLQSSLNTFRAADTTAPHFTVSGSQIIQNGKLSWRMYHAGPQGNVHFGVEVDPDVDTNPTTKASVERLIAALETKLGYKLQRFTHDQFMPTACGDDIRRAGLLNPPVPQPEPAPSTLEARVKVLEDKLNNIKGVL